MSMLAETRKKVKYSTNPRGTKWSNDDDKFGQKLMEKFGWQKGKGLGANEDGRVEHVRASKKTDSKGFGFKKNNNDNWICHQDDFNSLLSELNASHGSTTDNQENDNKVIISSLEEKSKSSKRRVHYHKHAKWKDLSGRSSEEMDCIFGRKKSKMRKEKTEVSQNVDDKTEEPKKDDPEGNDHGVQTIQSTQSCQEYFAMKLAQLKAKKSGQHVSACVPEKEVIEQDETAEVPASEETSPADPKAVGSDEERTENVDSEKSKKKKKKKSKEKERREEEDDCNALPLEIVEEENDEKSKKKKKKKLKEKESREEEVEDDCYNSLERVEKENVDGKNEADDNCEENCDENLLSKKSKKSKKKKRSKECIDDITEAAEITETVVEELPVAEDNEMEAVEINLKTKPKKKKHLKKCKDEISEPDTNAADGEILENSSSCDGDASNSINTEAAELLEGRRQSKIKKRKRTKDEIEAVDNTTGESEILDNSNNASRLAGDNDEETIASPAKKKKSSKKSKPEADEDGDALTADGSASDKMETHAEVTGSADTQGAETSSDYASDSSSNNSPPQVPETKQEIKRSPYAVSTATKMFQEAGANVDKISGYGYNVQ